MLKITRQERLEMHPIPLKPGWTPCIPGCRDRGEDSGTRQQRVSRASLCGEHRRSTELSGFPALCARVASPSVGRQVRCWQLGVGTWELMQALSPCLAHAIRGEQSRQVSAPLENSSPVCQSLQHLGPWRGGQCPTRKVPGSRDTSQPSDSPPSPAGSLASPAGLAGPSHS